MNDNIQIPAGSLSLIPEALAGDESALNQIGIVYSRTPVKLLDPSTNTTMSFSAYFVIVVVQGVDHDNATAEVGDGLTFVISADNSTMGSNGSALGVFDRSRNYTSIVKRVVVEFDTVKNDEPPINDIDNNHVSFDFMNISTSYSASAFTVGTDLSTTFHAWVGYSNDTRQLQVSVSNINVQPNKPLLSRTVDLSQIVEEYMWVGLTASSGGLYSNYYIQDWTFTVGPLPSSSGGRNWGMIEGLSVGFSVFLLVCFIFFVVRRRYVGRDGDTLDMQAAWFGFTRGHSGIQIPGVPTSFTYRQLRVACKNFGIESKLGEGGFGSVYGGVLPFSGRPVAVKKIKADSAQGERDFMAEVSIISQLIHGNLIKLLGWCEDSSKKQYLLVYDLAPNGSLDKKLFGPAEEQTASLSWERRFNIVKGTAAALDYLHHQDCRTQVIHRDMKSSNIMLDEDWNAKLGDFGLARLVDPKRETNISDALAGTYGYLAPEIAIANNFSDKSDVFGFGAVVLEVACGRKAWSRDLPQDQRSLVTWVWQSFGSGDLMKTVDPRLNEEYDTKEMELMLTIGLLCSHPDPKRRPSMRKVVQYLAGDAPVPSVPLSMPTVVLSSLPPHQRIVSFEVESTPESESAPTSSLLSSNSSHSSQRSTTRFFSMPSFKF